MIGFDYAVPMSVIGATVIGVVVLAALVILGSSRFVQGGVVERPERVPQLYGYSVCLVMLIWAVASATSIVGAALTLNDPLYRTGREYPGADPSASSFEAFRATSEMSRRYMAREERGMPVDSIPEAVLRRRYDALRADRAERNAVEARRALVVSSLSLLLAVALFVAHWRWLTRIGGAAPAFEGTKRIDI